MSMVVSADLLLQAYAAGVFPMAEARDDPALFWVDPRWRGVLPLREFRISRSLRRRIRRRDYTIRTDTAFAEVVAACAARPETWINDTLLALYAELHGRGHAHSLEVWQEGALAGGVFGITLGGAFFGESMFSARRDASKLALAYLTDRLHEAGFSLFDTQFVTDHLTSLGAREVARADYHRLLRAALARPADFDRPGQLPDAETLLQRSTQTS